MKKNHGYQERVTTKEKKHEKEKQSSTPKKPFRTPVGKQRKERKVFGTEVGENDNHQKPSEGEGKEASQLIFGVIFLPIYIYQYHRP